jgi:hypothetical protein
MKDIIRQAVADAAEWLHQNRSAVGSDWLKNREPEDIIRVCKIASDHDARTRRTEQLADFVARPVIDSVLIAGPEGEIARTGGFVGRCLMVPHTDNSRQNTADAAEFLWMRAPLHYSQGFLVNCHASALFREACRDFSVVKAGESYSDWMQRGKNLHAITGGSANGLMQWVGSSPSRADEVRWQSFKVPSDTVKLRQDGSLSNDSMSVQVGRLYFDFGLQERCADAARFLFDQGYDYALDSVQALLTSLSPAALIRDAHAFGYNGSAASKSGRDFNKEVLLPAPKDPMWSVPVTVTYDGAEGEGRVWLSTQEDDEPMIAIEGRENAATLASMLIDWVQPDVVVVPRAKLERLAKIDVWALHCSLSNEEAQLIEDISSLL